MKYMVQMTVNPPKDMDPQEWQEILRREKEYGQEFMKTESSSTSGGLWANSPTSAFSMWNPMTSCTPSSPDSRSSPTWT